MVIEAVSSDAVVGELLRLHMTFNTLDKPDAVTKELPKPRIAFRFAFNTEGCVKLATWNRNLTTLADKADSVVGVDPNNLMRMTLALNDCSVLNGAETSLKRVILYVDELVVSSEHDNNTSGAVMGAP